MVLESSNDAFGQRDYAVSLDLAIRNAPSGTTFGLFGAWGSGKSSVIQTLKFLQGPDTAVVVFDAWRYKEDAFRRAFLYDISEQLVAGRWLRGFNLDRDLRQLDVDTTTPREVFAFSWRRLMQISASVCLIVAALLAVDGDIVGSTKGNVGLLGLMGLLTWLAARTDRLLELRTETESRRRLEDADRFSRRFYEIVESVRAARFVVAIDNVDRLDPRAAAEVLATVKTYLEPVVRSTREKRGARRWPRRSPPEVCFVVAVDDAALKAQLASEAPVSTPDAVAYADEYLRKFFAVRLSLHSPTHGDMRAYIVGLVSDLVTRWEAKLRPPDVDGDVWREHQTGHLSDVILARPNSNPRRVKQRLNSVEMALTLMATRLAAGRIGDMPIEIGLLGVLVHMEEECPSVFAAVARNHELLDQLHAAAQASEGSPQLAFESDWHRLLPVLRASYSIDCSGAGAYLESRGYVEPGRSVAAERLIRSMRAGDGDRVRAELAEETGGGYEHLSSEVERIARALPHLVADELLARREDAALNLLRIAAEVEPFAAHRGLIARGLEAAMSTAPRTMLAGMWRIDPRALIAVVDELGEPRLTQVVNALAFSLADNPSITMARRAEIAAAVATSGSTLTEEVVSALRQAVDSTDWLSPQSYLLLVESYSDLLTDSVATRVWDEFEAAVEADSVDEPWYSASRLAELTEQPSGGVLLLAAESGKYGLTDAAVQILAESLGRARPETRARVSSLCHLILDRTAEPSTDAIDCLSRCVSDRLDLLQDPEGILLLDALLAHNPQDRGPGTRLLERIATQHVPGLPDSLAITRGSIHRSTASLLDAAGPRPAADR
jgi:hypothetical protein